MGKSDGKVTINTALNNAGLEKSLKSLGGLAKTVGATATAITAAFGTAAVAITKQSVAAYADYEQLTGGIETMFKNSAKKVAAYAEDAFYTAGVSANEYMETVTGFSASLISSLGGDTAKAADIANMAMIDMADNANKMGTPIENVKTAYQGFAKQQYMLLDNLKLGYGGTKTEMERLLKDAQAYSGVKYDINNLADVYSAIHAIQEKLGIAGATAEEAEKTITGSANMTKAAWKNVLAAISGGGDLDKAINNLVYSISKYFDNIVPVVERSLAGIGQMIERIAPQLVQTVASALIKALPSLLNAVYQMIVGLAKGIYQGIIALISGESATTEISAQLSGVADSANSAAEAEEALADGITAASKAAKKSLAGFDELTQLQDNSSSSSSSTGSTATETVSVNATVNGGSVKQGNILTSVLKKNFDARKFGEDIGKLINKVDWSDAFQTIGETVSSVLSGAFNGISGIISGVDWVEAGEELTDGLVEAIANVKTAELAGSIVELGITLVGSVVQLIWGAIKTICDPQVWKGKIIPGFGDLWKELSLGGLQGLINITPDASGNAHDFYDAMKSEDPDLEEHMWNAGVDVVKGFYKGILAELGKPFDWLKENWYDPWIEDFCEAWGIHSPATTMEEPGKNVVQGFLNGIVEGLRSIGQWIKENWFDPFVNGVLTAFGISENEAEEMITHGKSVVSGFLGGIVAELSNINTWLEENVINPFVSGFRSLFGTDGGDSTVMKAEGENVVGGLKEGISGSTAWSSLTRIFKEKLGGLKEAVQSIWNGEGGINAVIKNAINGIISFLNGLLSGIGRGVNGAITALNKLSFNIPDWDVFGDAAGKKFGFGIKPITVPQIPHLAQGAVLPPNKPFMAVVGDQRHGTNVEAPLSTIQEAVALVMQDQTSAILAGFDASVGVQREILEAVLGIQIGDDVIGNAVARYSNKQAVIRGGAL